MLRAVLDTNVLVSAVISSGTSREALKRAIVKQYTLVISEPILRELTNVLHRSKFKTSEEEIGRLILALTRTAETVTIKSRFIVVKDDPKDDMIVETAYDGHADMIVTGDKHLLGLHDFQGIEIITVKAFIERLALA